MGNLNTWLSYRVSDYSVSITGPFSALSTENTHTYFSSVGFEYDNGNFMLMGENAQVSIATDWFPTTQSSYLTAGYYIGDWMPHITWARAEDDGYDDTSGNNRILYNQSKVHQKSWTFGVRGDVASNLALKAEVTRYYDLGASEDGGYPDRGLFNTLNAMGAPDAGKIAALNDEDNPMVFRVSANLVF
jgi:hypothetical protein